jgi:undecaprenyl-diphosphatase
VTARDVVMPSRDARILSVAASVTTASVPAHASCLHRNPPLTPTSFYGPRRALLIAVGGLFAALALAAVIASSRLLLTWDEPITRWLVANRTPAFDTFFRSTSRLASTSTILVLGPVLVGLTWRRCRAVALAIAAATLARPLLEFTLKELVDRPRPDLGRLVNGIGPSFPSGHVMATVALWGLLPIVVGLFTTNRKLWWASVALSGTIIGLVAASRVYLGVHWFSDAFAGLLLGSFFLIGVETTLAGMHRHDGCGLDRRAQRREVLSAAEGSTTADG